MIIVAAEAGFCHVRFLCATSEIRLLCRFIKPGCYRGVISRCSLSKVYVSITQNRDGDDAGSDTCKRQSCTQ